MFEKILFYCFMQILINYSAICTANPVRGKSYEVEKGEYPFLVSLMSRSSNISDKRSFFCTGTLISKRLVLTAEHCIRNLNKNNIVVILNTLDSNSVREIKSWITYDEWALSKLSPEDIRTHSAKYYEMMGTRDIDNYNSTVIVSENDIAIIVLSKKVMKVEPAKLTALHDYELIGKDAVTVGWGSAIDSLDTTPEKLLQIYLKVLDPSVVRINLYKLFNIDRLVDPHNLYTSSDPPALLSAGDSGGPLMLRSSKKLIGVNVAGSDVAGPQISPYAVNWHVKLLDKYRKFIKDMENKILN